MRHRAPRRGTALLIVLATIGHLSGCAVGPDFQRPAAPEVSRYTSTSIDAPAPTPDAPAVPLQRTVAGRDIPGDWWVLFHCEALDALVREALANSPTLASARATLRVAQENVSAQRGAYFPSVEAQYSPTKGTVADAVASPLSSNSESFALHTAQLSISYVPDVFGANRRQVESLQAQADMQRFELEAAQVTLTSNVVSAVIQRAALQAQIRATRNIIASGSRLLALYKRGQALGQYGGVDLALQESLLATVLITLPPLEKLYLAQGNQLAALLGKLPADFTPPDIELAMLALPEELPVSLPSTLVGQRPDIRAAEETLHSASAQVGVAIANRLPNLALTAGAGASDSRFLRLFSPGTNFWSVSGSLIQPLFDGGTLLHRQRAAEAAYDQAAAQYRVTVLTAFQNVADTLGALDVDARGLQASTSAERAAEKSFAIAREQQAAGLTGTVPTVAAEQAWQQATLARIQSQADRLADTAALFQALGGGWWNLQAAE